MERPNAWQRYTSEQAAELERLATDYADFISRNKTERECVAEAIRLAREAGYRDLDECISAGTQLVPGDRVYAGMRGKSLILAEIGREDLTCGINILGAHVDSPRLDIKQNPVEEKNDLVYLDTHYYGGIKKYQWVTTPLAIHGVVAKKDGSVVPVVVGEDPSDPVFVISDLLVHLAAEQMDKNAAKVIEGELLDVLVGHRPLTIEDEDDKKDLVKRQLLALLQERYDIGEEDLMYLFILVTVGPAGALRHRGGGPALGRAGGHACRTRTRPGLRPLDAARLRTR